MEKTIRHRVNVSMTSKGIKSFECTVDITNGTEDEVLKASDSLVAQLDKRYPITIVDK